MYVITYRAKPATLGVLYQAEGRQPHYSVETDSYLATPAKEATIALYIHYFGFTWKERPKGVSCRKVGG